MKHTIRWIAAATLLYGCCVLFSFVVAPRIAEGIWKQLGITQQDGNDKIRYSFLDGYLHTEGLKNIRNIALGDRAATTAGLLTYTKQYVAGAPFKAAYEKFRKESRPTDPKYVREWEQQYPEDLKAFFSNRLQRYLKLASTVDFSATTHEKNGKQVFDKSEYQYKSNDWKMIYRAGKEVYDVTKPFAEKWLQELQ